MRLLFGFGLARPLDRPGARVWSNERLKRANLFGLKRHELIACLGRLQDSDRALALADQGIELALVNGKVLDDLRLHFHRVLESRERVLPSGLCIGDELSVRCGRADRGGIKAL